MPDGDEKCSSCGRNLTGHNDINKQRHISSCLAKSNPVPEGLSKITMFYKPRQV